MHRRWVSLISILLVAFSGMVIAWQLLHCDREATLRSWKLQFRNDRNDTGDYGIIASVIQSYVRSRQLAATHDIVKRDQLTIPASGLCRYIDLVLPKTGRVFMTDMTGVTNCQKIIYYYYVTYYLFPREVGVSLDQPAHPTQDGFPGRAAVSDQEIRATGYDAVVAFPPDATLTLRLLRPLSEFPVKEPVNPDWFPSSTDAIAAFLLPWLTALTGMWLVRLLFPALSRQTPLLEQWAYGLGLGMMAVAAVTLAIKLCGFRGHYLVCLATGVGAAAEIWRNRRAYAAGLTGNCRELRRRPVVLAIVAVGLLVFLVLFRLAGLQGLVDFDAPMAWVLKAKILHLFAGSELREWFSNPRLANAHLDYPTLVPSLHATTFDSLGHVNEFVTKFWHVGMLLLLLISLGSLNRGGQSRSYAPYFALLGLLLLPAVQKYAQLEGATLPMVFFTVLGLGQWTLWQLEKDRNRLELGLTLLFGAAMTKFEGSIFLLLAGGWLLLVSSAWSGLRWSWRCWRVPVFCVLSALPFVCLRLQITSVNYESNWAGHVLSHPGTVLSMLSNWWRLFLIQSARLFVHPGFASWSGENGQLHWTGHWQGISSLYNPSTLILPWLCLLMTIMVWIARPERRRAVVWILAIFITAVGVFSGIFASFANITSLDSVIGYTADAHGARYLLPILLAWFATIIILCFRDEPARIPIIEPARSDPVNEAIEPETETG